MSGKKLGKKGVSCKREPVEGKHGSLQEQLEEVRRRKELGRVVQKGVEHGIEVEKTLEANLNKDDPGYRSPYRPRELNSRARSWYKGSTEESSSSGNLHHQPVNSTKESIMIEKTTTSAEEAAAETRTKAEAYQKGLEEGMHAGFHKAATEMGEQAKGIWGTVKDKVSKHRGLLGFLLGAAAAVTVQAGVATAAKRTGFQAELRNPQGNLVGDMNVTEVPPAPQGGRSR